MRLVCVIALAVVVMASPAAQAQSTADFPSGPVKFVVSFAPGALAHGNRPAELTAWIRREISRWQEIAKAANIKPD